MNRVVTGLLIGVGVGVVTGSVVLLMRGKKAQRFARQRWQQLRSTLPEPEHVQRYAQQIAGRVAQAAGDVKDTAQQAVKKARDAGGDLVQQAVPAMKQTGQDGGAKLKEMVKQR